MTPEQAAALRKRFPASAVGKLPKPYKADSAKGQCRDCGGYHGLPAAHLDYVGHAATTDRLLAVDPDWSWEPFAVDERGMPALDGRGNLWIRLTVAGVTRIGVGDGKSAKECIGDAIRNAAMRFGVALDLWAKEDLHSMDAERGTYRQAEPTPRRTTPPPAEPHVSAEPDTITPAQLKKIAAAMRDLGVTAREHALRYVADAIGREVESRNELTKAEAHLVIESLESDLAQDGAA